MGKIIMTYLSFLMLSCLVYGQSNDVVLPPFNPDISNTTIVPFRLQEKTAIDNVLINYYKFNVDIYPKVKKILQNYYGREDFNDSSWVRVKEFLTWVNENNDWLSAKFAKTDFSDIPNEQAEYYLLAFLGANYVTKKMINEEFNFKIEINNRCRVERDYSICIPSDDAIETINGAIHEATHMFLFSKYGKEENGQFSDEKLLPEYVTIFSQLRYGLPAKISNNTHLGTRAVFLFADEDFIYRHREKLEYEYSEIVYSVTRYSEYPQIVNNELANLRYETDSWVDITLYYLLAHKLFEGQELDSFNSNFLANPIFADTLEEIIPLLNPEERTSITTNQEMQEYLFSFTRRYASKIAIIFVKNLRKYADRNIPPVPQGYM